MCKFAGPFLFASATHISYLAAIEGVGFQHFRVSWIIETPGAPIALSLLGLHAAEIQSQWPSYRSALHLARTIARNASELWRVAAAALLLGFAALVVFGFSDIGSRSPLTAIGLMIGLVIAPLAYGLAPRDRFAVLASGSLLFGYWSGPALWEREMSADCTGVLALRDGTSLSCERIVTIQRNNFLIFESEDQIHLISRSKVARDALYDATFSPRPSE